MLQFGRMLSKWRSRRNGSSRIRYSIVMLHDCCIKALEFVLVFKLVFLDDAFVEGANAGLSHGRLVLAAPFLGAAPCACSGQTCRHGPFLFLVQRCCRRNAGGEIRFDHFHVERPGRFLRCAAETATNCQEESEGQER